MGSILLLLMVDSSAVFAETTPAAELVILLQPTTASPGVRQSLARIRDELSADRSYVVLADSGTADDAKAVIEIASRDPEGGTTLALFGDPEAGQAELCVVERAAKRTQAELCVVPRAAKRTAIRGATVRELQQWSAAFDGGVGAAFAVSARAALVTELHALLASPHPVVRFVDTRAVTIGYPALMLTLALQVAS